MISKSYRYKILVFFALIITVQSYGKVKLPKLISDGMVLQRNTEIRIWGWASVGEEVTIHFIDSEYKTLSDKEGNWSVNLPKLTAGGPFEMQIMGSNSIVLHDVMIGDVWVCSGQ